MDPLENGWLHRSLLVLNPATPTAFFQVKVKLDPLTFDYSLAQPNGQDIRFYQVDGTELSHWIETWNLNGTSIIWIKVAASGTDKIYMYYGNPDASSTSSGDSTFEFFDDFDGDSLNADKWDTSLANGDLSIADSLVNLWVTTDWKEVSITSKELKKVPMSVTVSAKVKSSNGSCGELFVGLYNGALDKIYTKTRDATCNWGACNDGPRIKERVYGSDSSEVIFNMATETDDIWFNLTSKIGGDNQVRGYVNDEKQGSSSISVVSDGFCRIRFATCPDCCASNRHQYADWIFARKYASSEPTASFSSAGGGSAPLDFSGLDKSIQDLKHLMNFLSPSLFAHGPHVFYHDRSLFRQVIAKLYARKSKLPSDQQVIANKLIQFFQQYYSHKR